jgi:hypothetical protein
VKRESSETESRENRERSEAERRERRRERSDARRTRNFRGTSCRVGMCDREERHESPTRNWRDRVLPRQQAGNESQKSLRERRAEDNSGPVAGGKRQSLPSSLEIRQITTKPIEARHNSKWNMTTALKHIGTMQALKYVVLPGLNEPMKNGLSPKQIVSGDRAADREPMKTVRP